MTKIGKDYDLCELLRQEVLKNIELTKNNGYAFCFGSLIVCLAFYFLNLLPMKENVVWDENLPIGKQIKRCLDNLNDKDMMCEDCFYELWKNLILKYRNLERCVERYKDEITF